MLFPGFPRSAWVQKAPTRGPCTFPCPPRAPSRCWRAAPAAGSKPPNPPQSTGAPAAETYRGLGRAVPGCSILSLPQLQENQVQTLTACCSVLLFFTRQGRTAPRAPPTHPISGFHQTTRSPQKVQKGSPTLGARLAARPRTTRGGFRSPGLREGSRAGGCGARSRQGEAHSASSQACRKQLLPVTAGQRCSLSLGKAPACRPRTGHVLVPPQQGEGRGGAGSQFPALWGVRCYGAGSGSERRVGTEPRACDAASRPPLIQAFKQTSPRLDEP